MNEHDDILNDHALGMDRMYKVQRHFYDVTRSYYLLGRDRMLANLKPAPRNKVLEIGCGTGRNLIKAAQLYPNCFLYGIDISNEMLKSANTAISSKRLSNKIKVAHGDATNFDALKTIGFERFDRIYFSYTLSMVPNWEMAVRHAVSLLSENGELHIVDFGKCEKLPVMFKRMLFKWLELFHVTPRATLVDELGSLLKERDLKLIHKSDFGGYAWRVVLKS